MVVKVFVVTWEAERTPSSVRGVYSSVEKAMETASGEWLPMDRGRWWLSNHSGMGYGIYTIELDAEPIDE